jgi:hypothetical protein
MRPLPALERFFEQLFERPAVRLFRPRIQPVQIQRRIERAMETERMSGADRTLVPNRFRVHLHPDDLDSFGNVSATLAADLADGALAFARAHHYTLIDRPRVDLVADPGVPRGEIRVQARFAERARDGQRIDGSQPDEPQRRPGRSRPEADAQDVSRAAAAPAPVGGAVAPPLSDVSGDDRDGDSGEEIGRHDMGGTMVFEVPRIEAPLARLREMRPNGTQREIELNGAPLTIGRATDNALVLHDSRVSRHHARLQARRGTLVFTDLRSTNGSRVNGARVAEVALGEGDRIEIGDTILVVESVGGR